MLSMMISIVICFSIFSGVILLNIMNSDVIHSVISSL